MKKLFYFGLIALSIFSCGEQYNGELLFVEKNKQAGFNYPYYLFIPDNMTKMQEVSLIVEPNNTGFVSDELAKHKEKAKRQASSYYYIGNYVAQNLNYPLLVPVFPRPETNWKIYAHSLDRDAVLQNNNDLERLDLQLLAMIENAKDTLAKLSYKIKPKVFMTGFSASGTFASRFSLIHPESLAAVAAGGLNGLLMLPTDSIDNQRLIYPVGTADFDSIFNKSFNYDAFCALPQFWFMGETDDNDAIPYNDGYDEPERNLIYELLGEEMQPKRWNACKELYIKNNVNATIKTYRGIGHKHPDNVKEEILTFFKNNN